MSHCVKKRLAGLDVHKDSIVIAVSEAGRYDADEIRAEPCPSDHSSRQWGRMIRHPDGRAVDEPWPG
jgi:hypothetical protein